MVFINNSTNKKYYYKNHLRVFISSAQNNEGDFQWTNIRKTVQKKLNQCPYFESFIMEDIASYQKSSQVYQSELIKSDVVVLLLKEELRAGTEIEYSLARKYNIPLLAYFIGNTSEDSKAKKIQQEIQTRDLCTYKILPSEKDIDTVIMNDLINDIIRKYQNKPGYMFDSLDEFNSIAVPNLQDYKQETEAHNPIDELNYAPDKSAINFFQSSYRHAFCLLGINSNEEETEQSLFHDLGKTLINWLILGERINVGGLLTIVKHECRRLFNTTAWYEKRWESIQAALIGDYESSLKHEEESLEIAKKEGLATWVINDILIDCRNAKIRIDNNSHVYYDDNKAQEELNLQDTIINLPVLDRYLSNTYGSIVNEEFKIETSPHGTVFYGTRLHENITNTLNYYFSAILYGSYTHMLKSREILANVLYKYAGILEDNHLYFRAIELLLLLGDEKKCSNLINNKWDIIYSYYSCHADDIWTLTEKVSIEHRDSIRIMVLTELGAYFSDTVLVMLKSFYGITQGMYIGVILKSILIVLVEI